MVFNVNPDWNAITAIAAALALLLSLATFVRGERRAAAADARAIREEKRHDEESARSAERMASLEQQSAAQFEVVHLGGESFEGFPLLGIEVNGTKTVNRLAIDPESITSVGVGGATIWYSGEPGEILKHFWFRTNDRGDWPKTIRVTFTHPFEGSRVLRIPSA